MKSTINIKEVWMKKDHDIYTECMNNPNQYSAQHIIKDMPRWQWTKGWTISIISPSLISFNKYELFDWNDVERFDTLEQAQAAGDLLLKK